VSDDGAEALRVTFVIQQPEADGHAASANDEISLSEVYDVGNQPFRVVVAAIFGIAPGILIRRLRQQADIYAGIRSTEA
jgi:hypothetical protein